MTHSDLEIGRVLAIHDGGELPDTYAIAQEPGAARQMSAPPAAPFSAGVNTSDVWVRVDFALRRK